MWRYGDCCVAISQNLEATEPVAMAQEGRDFGQVTLAKNVRMLGINLTATGSGIVNVDL
jgi:hypothetical protein